MTTNLKPQQSKGPGELRHNEFYLAMFGSAATYAQECIGDAQRSQTPEEAKMHMGHARHAGRRARAYLAVWKTEPGSPEFFDAQLACVNIPRVEVVA